MQLIILVGNIGCGKSTLAKEFAKDDYYIVSSDSLRYMVGAGKYVFNKCFDKKIIFDSSIKIAESIMSCGLNVVIDETNMSRKQREPFIELGKKFNYEKIMALVFKKISKKIAISRRMKNNHGNTSREVWSNIYDNFNNSFEMPTHGEGFDSIYIK